MTPSESLAEVLRLSELATAGPWQVIAKDIPWSFDDGRTGKHTQRSIYTAWIHGQLKDYAPIATLSTGIGMAGEPAVNLISISEHDAALMVAAVNFIRQHAAKYAEMERDAARWRHARRILPVEFIEQAQELYEAFGVEGDEVENLKADAAIDAAIAAQGTAQGESHE